MVFANVMLRTLSSAESMMACFGFVAHAPYLLLDLDWGEQEIEVVFSQAVRVARGVFGQGWVGGRKSLAVK